MRLFTSGDLGAAAQLQSAEAMSSMSGDTCLSGRRCSRTDPGQYGHECGRVK